MNTLSFWVSWSSEAGILVNSGCDVPFWNGMSHHYDVCSISHCIQIYANIHNESSLQHFIHKKQLNVLYIQLHVTGDMFQTLKTDHTLFY